jgi:hypothetical protein
MTRIIENGFIINIFFFEEWTTSFFVHRLGWWTRSTLLRNLELGLCEATLFSLSAVIVTIIKIDLVIRPTGILVLYRPVILSLEHVIASSDLLRNRPYGVISMLRLNDETFVTPSSWCNADLNPVVFTLASPRRRSIWSDATTESNPDLAMQRPRRKRSRVLTASSPLAAAASTASSPSAAAA